MAEHGERLFLLEHFAADSAPHFPDKSRRRTGRFLPLRSLRHVSGCRDFRMSGQNLAAERAVRPLGLPRLGAGRLDPRVVHRLMHASCRRKVGCGNGLVVRCYGERIVFTGGQKKQHQKNEYAKIPFHSLTSSLSNLRLRSSFVFCPVIGQYFPKHSIP